MDVVLRILQILVSIPILLLWFPLCMNLLWGLLLAASVNFDLKKKNVFFLSDLLPAYSVYLR